MRLCRIRKAHYADPVSPLGFRVWRREDPLRISISLIRLPLGVDYGSIYGIMYLTPGQEATLGSREQELSTTSPPRSESPARRGHRSSFHLRKPFLRPQRPGPGQVRDAASGSVRPATRERCRRSFRLLPSFLLRDPVSLRAFGSARSGTPATRTAPSPQALGLGGRRPRPGASRRPLFEQRRNGPLGARPVRAQRPSPQHRAGAGTAQKGGPSDLKIIAGRDELERGYEALRAQVVGTATFVMPRGLALFRHSGMVAWMSACAPLPVTSARSAPQGERPREVLAGLSSELVRVLAEMAVGSQRGYA